MRCSSIIVAALGAALLAGCGMPRDPDGTSERVRASRVIRLGEIVGAEPDAQASAALARVARLTGAQVERRQGHGEEMLEALQAGELDLVYGRFADDSPWAAEVYFGEQPGRIGNPGKSERVPRFAFRNGENGWIATVENEVAR
ncbi:hypothetical protein [Aurantiacibacter luteus]|uniref:hypothetical protein n=1 Tax=Aurantiacibacter luteus TaxID=1581420 RepID=UPI00069B3BC8|nr:hypothetical protein [Aurantiacibacter luteus]